MKVAWYFWLIVVVVGAEEDVPETYTKNNPLDLKEGKVFFSSEGRILDLYSSDGEIRNILVPPTKNLRIRYFMDPHATGHPSIYFNLIKNGHNEGVYVLKNQTATKIRDGSDSIANYHTATLPTQDELVYISASDGIYTYNPNNDETAKFGNVTDDFRAIDKVSHKDEIYVLAADDKIYKITAQGTIKTKVEGIDYAKDFVLDLKGAIYFLGQDNKPQVLYEGSTAPVKIPGLNFEVKNAFLSRPRWDIFSPSQDEHIVPLLIDGVYYVLMEEKVIAIHVNNKVAGLTAFSTEYSFVHYYGAKGHIYMHSLVADH